MDIDAIIKGDIHILERQLTRGARIDVLDDDYSKLHHPGFTPLHAACRWGRLQTVEFLVSKGHPINCRTDEYDETPIMSAIHKLRDRTSYLKDVIEMVDYLHSKGADINHRSGTYTLLSKGFTEPTQSLLTHVNLLHKKCDVMIRHLLDLGVSSDIRKEYEINISKYYYLQQPWLFDIFHNYDRKEDTLFGLLLPILSKKKKRAKKQRIK